MFADDVYVYDVTADTVIDGENSTQGWNRYSYVRNNPIIYKDPTGHKHDYDTIEKAGGDPGLSLANHYLTSEKAPSLPKQLDAPKPINKADVATRFIARLASNIWEGTLGNLGHVPPETREKYSPLKSPKTKEEVLGDTIAWFAEGALAVIPIVKGFKGANIPKAGNPLNKQEKFPKATEEIANTASEVKGTKKDPFKNDDLFQTFTVDKNGKRRDTGEIRYDQIVDGAHIQIPLNPKKFKGEVFEDTMEVHRAIEDKYIISEPNK